jgi:sulfur relay (sulfurtransferase) DsrC/TusE family protein
MAGMESWTEDPARKPRVDSYPMRWTKNFVDMGDLKYLYRLFPKGPVCQGSRIANPAR